MAGAKESEMKIHSLTANAVINDSNWHPQTRLKKWHEKLRGKVIVLLLNSLKGDKPITWVKTTTG